MPVRVSEGFLRRVDDPHRVGEFDRVALEEPLVDRVQEVLLFGEGLPLSEVAGKLGTIPYEILTSVSNRVKRIYFQE